MDERLAHMEAVMRKVVMHTKQQMQHQEQSPSGGEAKTGELCRMDVRLTEAD